MDKNDLIDVFQDTLIKTECFKTSETTKHNFGDIITTFYDETPDNITVINADTVSAGMIYGLEGQTCVLNMASYKHPGGGVERGARAQEECLFRCSNLFHVVDKKHYPLLEDEALYTKDAIFIKDRYYNDMIPVSLDVVTIAAVNLNIGGSHAKTFADTYEYENLMQRKIRLMLSLAKNKGCENIILGAWGCGVFKNDPKKVATMFKNELYGYGFKNVIFAVINDSNSVDDNFTIFKEILG